MNLGFMVPRSLLTASDCVGLPVALAGLERLRDIRAATARTARPMSS